jgi:uncharacterized membrane protein YgcG
MFTKSLYIVGALAGTLVWSAAAQAAPGETTGTVNLRAGPGTAYAVIGKIPAGAPVNIVNCRRWCELAYGGREGYVSPNAVLAEYAPAPYAFPGEPSFNGISDGFDVDNGPWGNGFHHHHDGHGDGGGHDHLGGGHGGFGGGHGGMGGDRGHDRH